MAENILPEVVYDNINKLSENDWVCLRCKYGDSSFEGMNRILPQLFDKTEKHSFQKSRHAIKSGFNKLDELTTGFHNGELTLIAGEAGAGKTALALSIVINSAVRDKTPTAIVSPRMSSEQLAGQMLCTEAGFSIHKLNSGNLNQTDESTLAKHIYNMYHAQIFICDTPEITTAEIRAKCLQHKKRESLGLLIIDDLQLISGINKDRDREQEIAHIAQDLKDLALELEVPVIVLSQLSGEINRNRRPTLQDIGSIGHVADTVLLLHRESNNNDPPPDIVEIIVAKQYDGQTGSVKLSFWPECGRFENINEN